MNTHTHTYKHRESVHALPFVFLLPGVWKNFSESETCSQLSRKNADRKVGNNTKIYKDDGE